MTPEETRLQYIEKMGQPLGDQFYLLYQEVAQIHLKWTEFVELYGTKPTRVDLLNQAAPSFFWLVQNYLWENIILHVARLTDSPTSLGTKANLTLFNLPQLIENRQTRETVQHFLHFVRDKTDFCRDWRNRHIAHRDLSLALNMPATPLAPASRQQVREALAAIADVLNVIDGAYMDSSIYFGAITSLGGAASLLHVLDDGVRAEAKRSERLGRGEWSEEDYPRDL